MPNAKNINLRQQLEIMDAELIVIYKALSNLYKQNIQNQDIYVFADSQTALKRLQKISLIGGQRICYNITELCRHLILHSNHKISISWVLEHKDI
ncbi:hypothetical protein EJ02DRAFT_422627 [Clathrospora elynae]|uniref:RNase H type-1 domain-containing protein n=1 Tax=Clathrospora elynae TaxID=706981 RepID=A0A6A5SMM9_9PLEO|nr:hypothetical protein EJ02DRAFT_422627 [Clathrospora elynae]